MAITINGDNNGIAVDGDLNINHLNFVLGKGVSEVYGVHHNVMDAEVIDDDVTSIVKELLPVFYGDRLEAESFLKKIHGAKGPQITAIVNELLRERKISEISCYKTLWEILCRNGYYDKSLSNWNSQIKR